MGSQTGVWKRVQYALSNKSLATRGEGKPVSDRIFRFVAGAFVGSVGGGVGFIMALIVDNYLSDYRKPVDERVFDVGGTQFLVKAAWLAAFPSIVASVCASLIGGNFRAPFFRMMAGITMGGVTGCVISLWVWSGHREIPESWSLLLSGFGAAALVSSVITSSWPSRASDVARPGIRHGFLIGLCCASFGVVAVWLLWTALGLVPSTSLRATLRVSDIGQGVFSVAFRPDGKMLASGGAGLFRNPQMMLWDVATGARKENLVSHDREIWSIAFSPDGRTLASGSMDDTIKVWNVDAGNCIATFKGHNSTVCSVTFSPDGKILASSSADKTIKLWIVATGENIGTLSGHQDYVKSVAFSPDGKTLASGSLDQTIKLWDLTTHNERATLTGHSAAVWPVTFSPDGKTLASGSHDRTIKLWNVTTGQNLATFEGHAGEVCSVAFSAHGRTLASASGDKTIKLWNCATGQNTATLRGHGEAVYSVAFSPDGKTLASGSGDQTVKLWDISPILNGGD
jgi:WD40 repeat protein